MNMHSEPENNLIRTVIERLYENEGLTSALTDQSAQILLQWGEEELARLAQFNPEQSQIDGIVWQSERVLRSINHITEQRTELSETEMVEHLIRLVKRAMELGIKKANVEQGATDDKAT